MKNVSNLSPLFVCFALAAAGVFAASDAPWQWPAARAIAAESGATAETAKETTEDTAQSAGPAKDFTGEWTERDADGKVTGIFKYRDGVRHGPYQTFDKNGEPLSEGQYNAGNLDGIQRIKQEGGARTEVPYVDGKRSGVEKSWYPSGQIAVEAPWVDGVQEGAVVFYAEDGAIQANIPYYQGKIEGVQKTWYADGQRQGEESYRNNELHGPSEFWTQDGKPHIKLQYFNGKMNGLQTWYHPDGSKMREANFSQGIPDGKWQEWDESGKLIRDEIYEMGELLDPEKGKSAAPGAGGGVNSRKAGDEAPASAPAGDGTPVNHTEEPKTSEE